MLTDICISLTIPIPDIGRLLYEAGRFASVIAVRVTMPCAVKGYMIRLPCPEDGPGDRPGSFGSVSRGDTDVNGCGIFPAVPGTTMGFPRVLTHR